MCSWPLSIRLQQWQVLRALIVLVEGYPVWLGFYRYEAIEIM